MQQFYWKYRCMQAHWSRHHPSIAMPKELAEALKITDTERAQVKLRFAKAVGQGRAKRLALTQNSVDKRPKLISITTAGASAPQAAATSTADPAAALAPANE